MRHFVDIPITIINIETDGFHLMLAGSINNIAANFLIDTGASRSVFDKQTLLHFQSNATFIEKDGVTAGIGGNDITAEEFVLEHFMLGDFAFNNYTAVAIDLKNIHDSYELLHLPHIDGVIGGDILKKHKAIINYKNKYLRLWL